MQTLRAASSRFSANPLSLTACLLLWYLLTYVLLPVLPIRTGLDESWRAFLTWAFEHHRQFGTEVIFSYGPWGFLLEPRGPISVYPWQIAGRSVLAAAAAGGIGLLAESWIRSAPARWIWAAAIAILAEPATLIPVLLFLATMPAAAGPRWKRAVLPILAFATGLSACAKFTGFLLMIALLPVLAIRRTWAWTAAASTAAFLLCWLTAGQVLSNLPAFVKESLEFASGYSTAMVAGLPLVVLPMALCICGLPVIHFAIQSPPLRGWEALVRFGWLAGCEFLIFRHGLIRSDPPHFYMAFVTGAIPIAILLIAIPNAAMEHAAPRWRASYSGLVLGSLAVSLLYSQVAVAERWGLFEESLRLYPAYARRLFAPAPQPRAAAPAATTVDVFPDELSYVLCTGLAVRNRPVFQSYGAYTSGLCRKNAAFLEGPDAAGTIYFQPYTIDNRYPTMEDNLSWRLLLTRYEPSGVRDGYLVLRRRATTAPARMTAILDRRVRTGEFVDIPAAPGALIWAEFDIQRTFTGHLLDLLYRKDKMALRVETSGGAADFTLLDETAAVGFLLSPYVNSVGTMQTLYEPEAHRAPAAGVRRFTILRDRASAIGYEATVGIRLYRLAIGPSD
ncbi:MAG: hypothetical protein JST11_13445 [Acidobacteria bacterium]|nr:hypothetical protein [Acidobacteriota bacterium]